MSSITYETIIDEAWKIQLGIMKQHKLVESTKWDYYMAKAILQRHSPVKKIPVNKATDINKGNYFSRQIKKSVYLDMVQRFITYVETHNQIPNTIRIGDKLMGVKDFTNMFSAILVYYSKHGELPKTVNVNSKAFVKPTEDKNTVFTKWVNTFKFTPEYIDDVCDYIRDHFTYQFYFDDQKSNNEVIETKSGNCTDLLQMLINMAEALGYEWKVYHVRCNQSGTGHVYGMFKRDGDWFIRDIACIADESRYCVWCEAGNGGSLIATNPSWFLSNLRR